MTIFSLASKQIWPQVLAVAHLKPDRVILLHSENSSESKGPAQRLKRLFEKSGLVPGGGTRLEKVSDSDFVAVERRLDEVQAAHQLSLADCVLNFTGGNKLMATAASRWAVLREVRSFYLERRNQITWFQPSDGEVATETERLDPHVTDEIDPVALLRCQLDASEVERAGQAVTLNAAGRDLAEEELFHLIHHGGNSRHWLDLRGEADRDNKEGDALEFATAAVLLKLGVRRVQRSLRLKVKSAKYVGTRLPHAEIDLLFTWGGRLWLVDCKDRKPTDNLVRGLRGYMSKPIPSEAAALLERIRKELSIGQAKVLKEDLIAIREAGGLLGSVICVRKAEMPEEVVQYAKHNGMAVVRKGELADGLRRLLFPDQPADSSALATLAAHFQ